VADGCDLTVRTSVDEHELRASGAGVGAGGGAGGGGGAVRGAGDTASSLMHGGD
jgi:hypothetical protein